MSKTIVFDDAVQAFAECFKFTKKRIKKLGFRLTLEVHPRFCGKRMMLSKIITYTEIKMSIVPFENFVKQQAVHEMLDHLKTINTMLDVEMGKRILFQYFGLGDDE